MPSKKSYKRSKRSSKGKKSHGKLKKTQGRLKLSKITRSPIKGKKLRAHFSDGTHTDFGGAGMSDYTKHKDSDRMKRYLSRHRKRENWKSPKTPGALSRWVLWNKPSLRDSIRDYKRRFNL
jgi:hypothetical protein